MTRLLLGSAAILLGITTVSAPALAQKTQRYVEVYGDDACPMGSDNEVVVCAKKPESDRYRIPERLRSPTATPATETSAARAEALQGIGESGSGARGTGSCSPAGGNGWTGCWAEQIRRAKAEKQSDELNVLPD
jgi:hypothetical protein